MLKETNKKKGGLVEKQRIWRKKKITTKTNQITKILRGDIASTK